MYLLVSLEGSTLTLLLLLSLFLQVLAIEDVFRQPVTSIAFMGMGEPLMNVGAVLHAHRTINKVCVDPIWV